MNSTTSSKLQQSLRASHNDLYQTHPDLFDHSFFRSRKGRDVLTASSLHLKRSLGPSSIRSQFCDCGNYITDYTKNTTLHGLRYVGDRELHLTERFFWFISFILGIMCAGYYISIIYERWTVSPMIVSLSPTPVLLESIPFPAITICNMNDARKTIATEIMKNNKTDYKSTFEKEMIQEVCGLRNKTVDRLDGNWTTMQKFMIKISQPCHDMLVSCKYGGHNVDCNDIFNPELTDEGMCCSFNKVKRTFIYRNPRQVIGLMNYTFPFQGIDWTPETGYPAGTGLYTNPWRPVGPGRSRGLTVVLDAQVVEYYCSSTASIGFKSMIHNPVESPRMSDMSSFLTPGMETRVEIRPKITTSANNLDKIPLDKRLCLFLDERELRFYRTYTQRNCQLECQSNYTLNKCDCVPFYLPKDQDTRICGTHDSECVETAKLKMEANRLKVLVNTSDDTHELNIQCSCLPSCVTVEYSKQMSSGKLDDSFKVRSEYIEDRDPAYFMENMAVVHFFFVDSTFTSVEKGEIFGFTEFLSNTGGLLGLFLGFSIMSAFEILYYLSLRLFCSWQRNGRWNSNIVMHPVKTVPLPFKH